MFKAPTVDSILSVFTETIKKLDALEVSEKAKVERLNQIIGDATNEAATSLAEINKAKAAREKLNALFN